eukprot:TRINITY_DN27049_c0_g1_i1.p1 TRINITY_DN27049_c0_g1~~TRINITY_DN27049_c0_g1_i1.p1  ORF type:complete len:244 (-),score=-11.71 TRINITY_DN27049_c0_g1_i1:2-733(-)
MNLTSKRMLQFIAGCAGACALTASAVDPVTYVSDSFEPSAGNGTTNGYAGMLISQYKAQPIGDFLLTTNYMWVSAAGDVSSLVLTNSTYEATTRPLTNEMGSLVLNLATEGQTLTRVLDGNITNDFYTGGPYYVDTLIKFTPSEDYPTNNIDSSVKAAVFVNVSSNLVVYHGDEAHKTLSTDLGISIDPTQWYRLTIQLGKLAGEGIDYTGFKIYLNGIAITNAAAATDNLEYPGTWFPCTLR